MFDLAMQVRAARVEDAPGIAVLVNAANAGDGARAWTHEATLFEGPRTDAGEIRELIAVPGARFLLWIDAGEIAGCAYLKSLDAAAYLGLLAVRPDMQGYGIGSEIIAECERVARDELQRFSMLISVITTHRPELAAFYERRGYKRTGLYKSFDRRQTRRAPPRVEGLRPEWMEKSLQGAQRSPTPMS